MLLKRSNVTIVSPNALRPENCSRARKRYYSKSKRTSDAQTLLQYCQTLLRRSDVIIVMPNASLTVLCFHMFWFEIEANQDSVLWDQKMLPELWNRLLLPMLLCSISMSRKCLLKLELWSHRAVFGSIAWGRCFLNAFGHKGLSGHNVVTDAPLWVDHKMQ